MPETTERLLAAELSIAAGRASLAQGDRQSAAEHAGVARDLLADWPGSRRDEAMRLLGRAADDDRSGESPLTGREIDVARLLARGMTNGEIAEELFIARKTVSTHVSNILMKLGMRFAHRGRDVGGPHRYRRLIERSRRHPDGPVEAPPQEGYSDGSTTEG